MTEDERDKGKEEVQSLLKKFEDKIDGDGRQEVKGSDGTVNAGTPFAWETSGHRLDVLLFSGHAGRERRSAGEGKCRVVGASVDGGDGRARRLPRLRDPHAGPRPGCLSPQGSRCHHERSRDLEPRMGAPGDGIRLGIWQWWHLWRPEEAGQGGTRAIEFVTGYLVEKSLSVDNLFVFLVIFNYFAVPASLQHRVLVWGIVGAVVIRAIMILLGAALLHAFHWMIYVFGAFLIYTGYSFRSVEEDIDPSRNWFLHRRSASYR